MADLTRVIDVVGEGAEGLDCLLVHVTRSVHRRRVVLTAAKRGFNDWNDGLCWNIGWLIVRHCAGLLHRGVMPAT